MLSKKLSVITFDIIEIPEFLSLSEVSPATAHLLLGKLPACGESSTHYPGFAAGRIWTATPDNLSRTGTMTGLPTSPSLALELRGDAQTERASDARQGCDLAVSVLTEIEVGLVGKVLD